MRYSIDEIQIFLQEERLDGWLLYNFRNINPFAQKILSLPKDVLFTRRYFYFIPSRGVPRKLVHQIEAYNFNSLPGDTVVYSSWQSLEQGLQSLLSNVKTVAMEYSPNGILPTVSVIDAGTFELVKKMNIEIRSSAQLLQYFEARLTEKQFYLHSIAARHLREIVDETFRFIRTSVLNNTEITEYNVQQIILSEFRKRNLVTSSSPNCSVNANSANPHYEPTQDYSSSIKAGDFVLIDLWAKCNELDAVYADITWTAYVGEVTPEEYRKTFDVVRESRNTALEFVRKKLQDTGDVRGYEVDNVARSVIQSYGLGEYFIHRTGHSLGEEVHGNGANLDNLETRDERKLIQQSAFTIEPGVYFPGKFGVRSEINVYITNAYDCIVSGMPIQEAIIPILH
ncbi:MAG: M24 family metallopeptidase [Bacteroidetes bacterium]|nr:M24 family metallopeptidase [Bacteroidota bacterium]